MSFQPETLETATTRIANGGHVQQHLSPSASKAASNINSKKQHSKQRGHHARYSLSAPDLHLLMMDPAAQDSKYKSWGNTSLMLFTADGTGNVKYWCFPVIG